VTGRTANRVQDQPVSAAAVGRLAGPDGLTEHASSFTGPEVLVAVGAGLAGAGRTELEALADRGWPSGRSGGRRPGPGGAPLVHPDLLAVEQLGAAATGRTGDHPAVVSHAAVREALVGSRKLTRLLEHAEQAQAKVVLVGDDRQLAAIDAGGGFHAHRLRLGASELTEVATVEATARQPLVSLPPGRAPRSGGRALCGSRPPAS
jgi:hypothetical protein